MLKKFREKLACFISPEYKEDVDKILVKAIFKQSEIDNKINQRVAEISAHIDPLDFLMRDYNGIFSNDFEKPEENLNDAGKLGMYMWAWKQKSDPYFEHMVNWIMDTVGNETIKRAPIIEKRVQYGRAQISNMVLFKKEIGRLSSEYESILNKGKPENFDSSVGVGSEDL